MEPDHQQELTDNYRAGTAALIGRPNTGKSSLLNRLLKRKVSIVSPRSQTTRRRILGLLTAADYQIVFMDTPGQQNRYHSRDHQRMNHEARQVMDEVDLLLWVVEAGQWTSTEEDILAHLPHDSPVVLVVNKVDLLADKALLLPYLDKRRASFSFAALVPVSARDGHNIEQLLSLCRELLPKQPRLFDPAHFFAQETEQQWLAELIREQLFRCLGDELPYEIKVEIDHDSLKDQVRHIHATLLVARDSQKGLIIGKAGNMLKKIGTQARIEMERSTGDKIHLSLWAKIQDAHRKTTGSAVT